MVLNSRHFVIGVYVMFAYRYVDIAIPVPEPLADPVTNQNGGLWRPVSLIWCEHVLWYSLDDQIYWFSEYHVAKAPKITLNERNG